jgi:hypothetical protein
MSSAIGPLLGVNAKVYYLVATRATWSATVTNGFHTGAAPGSLVEVKNVHGEVKVNPSFSEADVTIRGSLTKTSEPTLDAYEIDVTVINDPSGIVDASSVFFANAMAARTAVALAVLNADAALVGATGIWADMKIHGAEEVQSNEGVVMTTYKFKPCFTGVPPEKVRVA